MTSDWLERTKILIGTDGLKKLQSARVLVVGLGGVGAFAAGGGGGAGVGAVAGGEHLRQR
jgi:tRNA A37 threonylcarbamoyladenosine dehydratase